MLHAGSAVAKTKARPQATRPLRDGTTATRARSGKSARKTPRRTVWQRMQRLWLAKEKRHSLRIQQLRRPTMSSGSRKTSWSVRKEKKLIKLGRRGLHSRSRSKRCETRTKKKMKRWARPFPISSVQWHLALLRSRGRAMKLSSTQNWYR